MYTGFHAAVGTTIVAVGYTLAGESGAVLSSVLAFASHDVVDRIGEKNYGSITETLKWEAIPHAALVVGAFLSGLWWLFGLGWLTANLMDIIDKNFYRSAFNPVDFPFKQTFACHRRAPNIYLTVGQTKVAAIIAAIALVAIGVAL